MSACRKTPDTYSRKALGMSATAMKPKTSRTWNFDPIKPRRRSKITLARLRPTRNSIRPSSRKLRLKSEMTARFETSEVWRVSGGHSVCASTNAIRVAPATPTAISSRRRRLRSASRCGLTGFFAANSSTPHQREQQGRGDADKNASGEREVEAEVAATEVDVAGQLPIYGTDDKPHSASPTTTIAIPAKTRLFPIGAIAELSRHRLYKTDGSGNTRGPALLRGA